MKKMIVANWKMQLNIKDSLSLTKKMLQQLKFSSAQIVICPDYLSLVLISPLLKKTFIALGAQDSAVAEFGAYTGEISAVNLRQLGVKYVILGHSERRNHLHENSAIINAKIRVALSQGIIPILCIGEKLTERNNGEAESYLNSELHRALKGIKIKRARDLIIAYEPIWAISTNHAARPILASEADRIQTFIKKKAQRILKKKIAVLYGGSVNDQNAADFLAQKNIDGLLIGAAALQIKEFSSICSI